MTTRYMCDIVAVHIYEPLCLLLTLLERFFGLVTVFVDDCLLDLYYLIFVYVRAMYR